MYKGVRTSVRSAAGDTKYFPVDIGLHQGSALSPFLFTIIMDELTREIQDEVPWCMLFADDIVLIHETRAGLNEKLERWRHSSESRGFRLIRSKTEYLRCRFSGVEGDRVLTPRVEKLKYLGSIVEEKGDIDEDINHRIRVGWQKWRKASGVLCDKRMPFILKGKIYRMVVLPALLFGTECWPIKKTQGQRLMVVEMRIIRWMCGYTRLDRIRNVVIRERVGVVPLKEKLRETKLRWFGHVKRMSVNAPVTRCEAINLLHCRRGRGRPRMS